MFRSYSLFFVSALAAPLAAFAGTAALTERIDLPELFRAIDRAESVEVLEGLPHPVFEKQIRQLEEARVRAEKIDTELFYPTPVDAPAEQITRLVQLTTDLKGHSKPLRPISDHSMKFCGGFHADYVLRWRSQGTVVASALVCFSCSEVRYLWREYTLTADYKPERHRELIQTFRPLRRQRPITELFQELEKQRKNEPFKLDLPEKIELAR